MVRLEDLPISAQRQVFKNFREQGAKPSKYRNEPVTVQGIRFDSKKEAQRYGELLQLLRVGGIRDLRLQQDFTLQEAYTTPEGERIRAIRYRADFVYERPTAPDRAGQVYRIKVVEDVKGRRTKDYIMKRKMMREKYGISIVEI